MASVQQLFSLEGQNALVTGGTRGIGQAMAIALAEAGADIILVQVRNASIPILYINLHKNSATHPTKPQNRPSRLSVAKQQSTRPTSPPRRPSRASSPVSSKTATEYTFYSTAVVFRSDTLRTSFQMMTGRPCCKSTLRLYSSSAAMWAHTCSNSPPICH